MVEGMTLNFVGDDLLFVPGIGDLTITAEVSFYGDEMNIDDVRNIIDADTGEPVNLSKADMKAVETAIHERREWEIAEAKRTYFL